MTIKYLGYWDLGMRGNLMPYEFETLKRAIAEMDHVATREDLGEGCTWDVYKEDGAQLVARGVVMNRWKYRYKF